MIQDVPEGVASTLELRFVRGVLRRHGAPERGGADAVVGARSDLGATRADRGYRALRGLIELDGVRHHQGAVLVLDRLKSNRAAVLGWVCVRFGWAETVDLPCVSAAALAELFWVRGWRGTPRPCSPGCPVGQLRRERPA